MELDLVLLTEEMGELVLVYQTLLELQVKTVVHIIISLVVEAVVLTVVVNQ